MSLYLRTSSYSQNYHTNNKIEISSQSVVVCYSQKTTRREKGNKNLNCLKKRYIFRRAWSVGCLLRLWLLFNVRWLCLVLFKGRDYKIVEVSLVPTKTVDGANLKITTPFLGETEITWNAWLLKKSSEYYVLFFLFFFFFSCILANFSICVWLTEDEPVIRMLLFVCEQ